ncbi:hypothetical protein HELRODRAFT_180005 [Helobdella robusta]|uniref:Antistasin-like domain-containing protein n=1 Tax=Helobdella robusta TaxID=6412 RepID=T1FFC0_HELRO|nr:hypothetical protein HELRODRAFT_180005 [Helobdella robusta]ESN94900.1 hypothetical protein HELRODRAFT_180005 [Helobdella robusta]
MSSSSVLLVLLYVAVAYSSANLCPPCPPLNSPCHDVSRYFQDPGTEKCLCEYCKGFCVDSEPCPKGTTCKYKNLPCPWDKNKNCPTSECVKFTNCEVRKCETKCPKTGYKKDPNGCNTCQCEDPCKELCNEGQECSSSIVPGGEFVYQCHGPIDFVR